MRKFLSTLLISLGILTQANAQTVVYEQTFGSSSSINDFTIFHRGSGTKDWYYSSGYLTFWDRSYTDVEAWAVTPGINLEAGKMYKLSFDARNSSSSTYTHNIYVYLETTNNQDEIAIEGSDYLAYEVITSNSTSTQKKTVKFSVPANGTYYLGFVDKGELKSTNNVNLDNITVEETVEAPNAATGLTVEAAEQGVQSATLTWTNPELTDMGNKIGSISKIEIYRGTTSYNTELAYTLNDAQYLTPGAEVNFTDNDVPERGTHYYDVVVWTNDAKSPEVSAKSPWIGKDTSLKALGDITATVNGDNNVVLDFAIPEGSNGAYVDPADVAFKIERKLSSSYSYTVINSEYSGELPYIDTTTEPFNVYTYRVSTIYNGSTGSSKTSNNVSVAGVATVPYNQGFNDSKAFDFFTKLNGTTGLIGNWAYYSYNIRYYNGGRYGDTSADTWTFTPKIKLEAGKVYQLSYDTWISTSGESNYKDLYVTIGTAPTVESQTVLNEGDATVSNTSSTTGDATRSAIVTVAEDGEYNIGFHVYGKVNTAYLYLDNISLVEIIEAPVAVDDLTVTPNGEGLLEATATWTNPKYSNAGNELTALTKAELLRDGSVIYTVENPVPGAVATYTDNSEDLTSGNHTYTVVAYIKGNASEPSQPATAWIGPDALKAVDNAKAELSADGTCVFISFDVQDPANGGANGGFIGEVAYKVVRMPDEVTIAENATESPVADDTIGELSLGAYFYKIYVTRGSEESDATATDKVVLGNAIKINAGETYSFDFSTSEFFDLWTNSQDETITKKWSYSSSNKYIESSFYKAIVFTPRFHLLEGEYDLNFSARSFNGQNPSNMAIFLATDTKASVDPAELEIETLDTEKPSTILISNRQYASGLMVEYTDQFNVDTEGDYLIGFQHNPDKSYNLPEIMLTNVSLSLKSTTGVENVSTGNRGLAYDIAADSLIAPEGASVAIYRMDGSLVFSCISSGNISVSNLSHGIYVVRVGTDTLKFIK
ncbi:MAG: choice-of-anchor J domain-containing protein [Bacteroidales bacterium]|nr:choice-of-anchor J domain-containing protein [Bacteroidales bacterium]